jgi:hypothetical protein
MSNEEIAACRRLAPTDGSVSFAETVDGDYDVILPALGPGEYKIPVHVATWKNLVTKEEGKLVSFNEGTRKNKYAEDWELVGAKFYSLNTD